MTTLDEITKRWHEEDLEEAFAALDDAVDELLLAHTPKARATKAELRELAEAVKKAVAAVHYAKAACRG